MPTRVFATNEMKSNLAAHIRHVAADPRRRVFVGAHRRAEAVLVSTYSEVPEPELHMMAALSGRALGFELASARSAGLARPDVGEYRRLLAVLASRGRRPDCVGLIAAAVGAVAAQSGLSVASAVREVGELIGDALEPDLDWADLALDVEDSLGRTGGIGQEGKAHG